MRGSKCLEELRERNGVRGREKKVKRMV